MSDKYSSLKMNTSRLQNLFYDLRFSEMRNRRGLNVEGGRGESTAITFTTENAVTRDFIVIITL